jgi:hypothetical protein
MGNRHKHKGQASLLEIIQEHRLKIDAELRVDVPNYGRIKHWEKEIEGWERQLAQMQRQLTKHRRKPKRADHGES